jgi:membrane protease subunit HflC
MQTEREREAKEFRAQGAEIAQRIRSTADKEVTIIKAQAEKQSNIIRGQGDGVANKVFAEAFGKDPEFFAFYRAMQAYAESLNSSDTSMILSPESEFFKYFSDPSGDQ